MKNILVCIKQVPDTTEIRIDPVKKTLIREGVPSIVNPFDAYALELAARIKDKEPGTKITLVSMGPPQAENALRECLAVGGDKAYLVSGREFGGSDTLATSYILSCAIKKLEELEGKFDIIFCGKQAIDGDTAQVGPEMAEHLGIPQVTGALKVALGADGRLLVERENESSCQTLAVTLPAVVTVTKSEKEPRFASIKGKMKARKAEIPVMGAAELEIDPKVIGLSGSPTKVLKIFTPSVPQIESEIINEEDTDKAVDMLIEKLVQAKIITH